MLTIRLQRRGRTGQAQFRLIVQDSRFSPTSGRVVSYLGSYNPHSKELQIDKDGAADYLQKGAQPSAAAARLLAKDGVKLPAWVATAAPKKRSVRNPDKLRRNRPAGAAAPPKPAQETTEAPTDVAVPEPESPAAEESAAPEATPKATAEVTEPAAGAAPETPAEEPAPEPEAPTKEPAKSPEPETS